MNNPELTEEEWKQIEAQRRAANTPQALAEKAMTILDAEIRRLKTQRECIYNDATLECPECKGKGGQYGNYSFIDEEHPWYTCHTCEGARRIWRKA